MYEELVGEKLNYKYEESNRIGDYIWWIGDNSKFERHYPEWKLRFNVEDILLQIFKNNRFSF